MNTLIVVTVLSVLISETCGNNSEKTLVGDDSNCCGVVQKRSATWGASYWDVLPTTASWSIRTQLPMTRDYADEEEEESNREVKRDRFKVKKKYKRFLLPLLLAYKLKFFTLIPVLIGGLVLLTGATGLAGFFFALFAAVMGLKSGGHH